MNKYKTIEAFLNDLAPEKRAQVDRLRAIIKQAAPELQEHIKWNAPSYVLNGEDRITFNLMNKEGVVKLVFHMGATRKEDKQAAPILHDPSGRIQWSSDIRGLMSFADEKDIINNEATIVGLISDWLAFPVEQ